MCTLTVNDCVWALFTSRPNTVANVRSRLESYVYTVTNSEPILCAFTTINNWTTDNVHTFYKFVFYPQRLHLNT